MRWLPSGAWKKNESGSLSTTRTWRSGLETISGFNKELKTKDEEFWKSWPKGKPAGYEKFLAWARKGKARKAWKAPEGVDRKTAQKEFQKQDIEQSIEYCKSIGLGRK